MKSPYKKLMSEAVVSTGKVYSNPFANSFKSPKQIEEDLDISSLLVQFYIKSFRYRSKFNYGFPCI